MGGSTLRTGRLAIAAILLASAGVRAAMPMVSVGEHHSVALAADGTVRTWGRDRDGELGVGRRIISTNALAVPGLANVIALSAADSYTVVVKGDGSAWSWGYGGSGALGDGTGDDRSSPAGIPGLPALTSVSARNYHSVGLQQDGTVWAWGENGYGQIGDGTTTNRGTPVAVLGAVGVTAVSVGDIHTLALRGDGAVYAWGGNSSGQVGNGTTTNQLTPALVPGLSAVKKISAGGGFNLALRSDGTVWSWGANESGQLGDGTFNDRATPAPVAGLTGRFIDISAGGSHALALRSDGVIFAWGYNGNLLGDGTSYTRATPGPVSGLAGVTAIAAGSTFSLALKSDGSVWSWGYNDVGQLGDGTRTDRSVPVQVVGVSGIDRISAGYAHALARKTDGTLLTWGDNGDGQLGDGTLIQRLVPAVVPGLSNVVSIASGDFHVLALKADGTVWAWGGNAESELGDGTGFNRSSPAQVQGVSGVVEIAAGGGHSIARKGDGTLVTWGYNYEGQLGVGSAGYNDGLPAAVPSFTNAAGISAGYQHSVAVKSDGTVWAWGSNASGQLGDATTTDRSSPTQVQGLSGVKAVSAGNAHTLALKSDGTVWAWGDNSSGQLGDGTTTNRSSPVQVAGLANIVAISAGGPHSLALAKDGTVWAWGDNEVGMLGDGTQEDRLHPVAVPGLSGVASISAGRAVYYGHSVAATSDGAVWSWGDYTNGQLGDGTLVERDLPVVVLHEDGGGSVAGNDWFLDLAPAVATTIPPSKVPLFLVVTSGTTQSLTAAIQFRTQDVGSAGSVYVFALAPATLVNGAMKTKDASLGRWARGARDDAPAPCVLAQLDSNGALTATSASSMQAYTSGVLGAQGQAVTILNGASQQNIAGATFYVGYGPSSSAMINGGTNRSVASISGETTCQPQAPQTGWWWNPAEPGRGFSIEEQGSHIFFAAFQYDVSGRATWNVATGSTSLDGSLFTGDLLAVSGGQTLGGPYNGFPNVSTVGSITLNFADASHGTMTWPGGTVPIERQPFTPDSLGAPALANQPESGWWWNPNESGRGFFIEWQGAWVDFAGYMYDDSGNPVWYIGVYQLADPRMISGSWWTYANGQSMLGPYKPAMQTSNTFAPVTITFSAPDTAVMTLPNNRTTALTRQRY